MPVRSADMRLWNWIGRLAGVPRVQFDAAEALRPIDQVIMAMHRGTGRVSRATALTVPVVLKGRNLLVVPATLPLVQRTDDHRIVRSPLLAQIDPNVPNVVTMSMTFEDLAFEGVAWWRVLARDAAGYPTRCRRIDPSTVTITPATNASATVHPSGLTAAPAKEIRVDGKVVAFRDIIRFDSPNPGVLKTQGRAISRLLELDETASMYAGDPRPLDYFEQDDETVTEPMDEGARREFLSTWKRARRTRSTAFVPPGVKYHTVDTPNPSDLQLVELQRKASLDIANAFGIDPEDLGISTTSRTYQNAVDRRQDRISNVNMPYMQAITQRLSMLDVTREGHHVEFNLDEYLRANPTERWANYEVAHRVGALTVDEIRKGERMTPLPPGARPAPAPAPDARPPLRVVATGTTAQQFDATDTEHRVTFDAAVPQQFGADVESRVITGLAVPWGAVGRKHGLRFRFRRGSLQYGALDRVKHYQDHVHPVGHALTLTDTDAGLLSRMSVARTQRGDELLALAHGKVYDGLSIGVDFSLDPADGDVTLGGDGVYDVHRATLREITTTAMPAFDDARVTSVAASRDNGGTMPCAKCGNVHAPGAVDCPTPTPTTPAATAPPTAVTFTADQVAALFANGLTPQQFSPAAPTSGPAVVDPTGSAVTTVVEPEPYRFDGRGNLQRGSHDFSSDLFAAQKFNDSAALDRATAFVQEQFARIMFDVNTGNVAGLNPTRQRPDMYVDQKQFRYPMWEAISKGSLDDITPFTFPKFGTAAGLVGPHTEGVEPTSGTYTATTQTITPGAISGKAKITRETWDQGGNPQVSNLIWNKMVQGWYESLEARAVAVLDAATPTPLATFTAGGGTDKRTLVAELSAGLAGLQFVRGGYRFTDAFAQVNLYQDLAAAKDADGRPLLPVINPTNSNGRTAESFGAIQVGPTTFYPAWALAASSANAASSYLFDRADVHGWASAPQRLQFDIEVAHIYIGVWGYAATAISDITGVREITYDPVA